MIPSDPKLLLMILVSISGVVFYFYGQKILSWANLYKDQKDAQAAADGRDKSDTSDQNLNDQTSKLPKD